MVYPLGWHVTYGCLDYKNYYGDIANSNNYFRRTTWNIKGFYTNFNSQNKYLLYFEGSILEESHYTISMLKEYGNIKGEDYKTKVTVFTSRENIALSKGDEVHFGGSKLLTKLLWGFMNQSV